jgi:diguanylate cyclase
MTIQGEGYERTIKFGEIALGQIKALRQSATPLNFEIWYAYATGRFPSLNEKINQFLKTNGALSDTDLENIYNSVLSNERRYSERIDAVGGQVLSEIDQVMAMIDAAAGTASTHGEALADMTGRIGLSKDRNGLRAIVEGLVHTANEMEASNQELEARLSTSKKEINDLRKRLDALRKESLTDPLTQLANRKFFDAALQAAIMQTRAKNEPLSLMMIDIDDFKTFNDSFGHLTGDQVLQLVAASINETIKGQDIAARYGGEEFAVILPNAPLRSAIMVADHVRRALMARELVKRSTGKSLGRITVSIGVATLNKVDNVQSFVERADGCLYAAKRHGRNKVICESDPEVDVSGLVTMQMA